MSYPGNPSLSPAVKDRVRTTFNQTVALYRQNRPDEVIAGCNLILQMDPQFEPARQLLEKTRNPDAPIDVDALAPPDTRSLTRQARDAMAARDFQTVIHVTTQILTDDLMNDEARILGDEAREKMEASPFVEQFVRKCDANLAAGNLVGARQDLEKARALDPTHPEIIRIAFAIEKAAASQPQPASSFSFEATPFVVEAKPEPAGGGRSAAPATDFGFTFEEEKAPAAAPPPNEGGFANFSFESAPSEPFGGFSFDSPAAPSNVPQAPAPTAAPPAPAFDFGGARSSSAEFDFSMASVETSPDDQRKIEQYLGEGDRAYDNGEYQQAIDFWSRIFLIDVTNEAASDRIEKAKARRREIEQKVEAILTTGIQAFDRKDRDTARTQFQQVLFLDPNNATAQDYLDRIDAPATAAPAETAYIPPPPVADDDGIGFFDDEMPSGSYAPVIPPDPSEMPATAPAATKSGKMKAAPKSAAPAAPKRIPVAALAAVLVVLLAAAGWFAWSRFGGGGDGDTAATAGDSTAVFSRATVLAENGKFDEAIAALQSIQPGDPQHDRALEMIADLQQKKGTAAAMIDGVPAAQYYDQQLNAARTAFAAHDYSAAKAAFEAAMRVKALPPDLKASYDAASQQVAKLGSAKALFAERKYADALTNLQTLAAQDPENKNIQRMIVNAHFNLGAAALQDERMTDAIREFDEVLKVDPNDEVARRSKDLAQRYNGEPKDLLYRIYVKYLPVRNAA